MEQGGIHKGQLGWVRRPNCGAGAQCVPTTRDGGVLVTPPHPTPQCPPFDLRALPLPSGRKSRVACQEPGAPGNYASCKHGPATGLFQSRQRPDLVRHTPNSEQSRCPQTAAQSHVGGGQGLALPDPVPPTPPQPPPLLAGSSTLASPPPPQLVSGVCELLMLPSLPCLEAGREGRRCLPRHTSGRQHPEPRAVYMYALGPWASRPLRPCPALLGS